MKTVSVQISYIKERREVRIASYLFALALAALLVVNAVFVGLAIGARAFGARAAERSATASARIAEFESSIQKTVATEESAVAEGFAKPLSSSYAKARPIGRAVSSNEL